MSEIGLNINVDSYNNEGIKTIKGNNNAEIYKLYILKNKRRLSLVGKTVKLGYVMAGTTKGDIVENLNITNAEQGEITLPITNRISKNDGVYSCQLVIYGADEFLEYTATFGLTVEDNIFTKIAGEIENSKDLTYIERILDEAKTVSGDLKTNIPVATNLNSSLENNISNARNINTTLADTTEKSKVAATDAIEKKSQLESSIVEAKEFIEGLDGSQNIPQLRLDVTELQNGLKSNQALSYEGSSISAENTLEGRTEGMVVKGRTLQNIVTKVNKGFNDEDIDNYVFKQISVFDICSIHLKPNTTYTLFLNIIEMTDKSYFAINSEVYSAINGSYPQKSVGIKKIVMTTKSTIPNSNSVGSDNMPAIRCYGNPPEGGIIKISKKIMLLEGDWSNKEIPPYFEGIKSFGESEREDDKYKISILSRNKNLFKSYEELISVKKGEQLYLSSKLTDGCTRIDIQIDNKTDITVSDIMYWRGTEKLYRLASDKNKLDVSFTVNRDCNIKLTNKYLKAKEYKDIQLEKGTQVTQYEPYKCDKKDILLKEPLKEGDYVYEDNGQVKVYRDARKYVITGNEDWSQYTDNKNFACMGFFLQLNKNFDAKLGGKFICNNFKGSDTDVFPGNITVDDEIIFVKGRSGEASPSYIKISILKSKLTTQNVEGFKEWLKANPTEIVYQLATPTTEIVENCVDIDLDTYQEKTYFNILNSLPGTLDFKVPSNIGSLVQSNSKEINNINEFINNFILKALLEMNKDLAAIKIKNGLN
ncbi:BppU family phage baseplate upper protein [Clostridium perfringens]